MAIQIPQPFSVNLQGDDASTLFEFQLGDLFAVNNTPIQNKNTTPARSGPASVNGFPGISATVSIAKGGIITLQFSSALPSSNMVSVNFTLYFDGLS